MVLKVKTNKQICFKILCFGFFLIIACGSSSRRGRETFVDTDEYSKKQVSELKRPKVHENGAVSKKDSNTETDEGPKARVLQENPVLKRRYRDYFPVGTAVSYRVIKDRDKADFIAANYSSITTENEMKPWAIQPQKGLFTWENADRVVNFAIANRLLVRGHCIVGYGRMPSWFYKGENKQRVSKEQFLKNLKEHIYRLVGRYKGKVYCWDVVNEAVSDKDIEFLRADDEMFKIAGEEYISKAFEYAHEADPRAKLFYNDYGFFNPRKRNKIYKLLKKLKEDGVPIHGVGMQTHLGIDGSADYKNGGKISEGILRESIDMFSRLGLEVQITELDVVIFSKMQNAKDVESLPNDYTRAISNRQADMYDMVFRVGREMKGKLTGITLWGAADWPNVFSDRYGKNPRPYLFDESMKEKEPLKRIMDF